MEPINPFEIFWSTEVLSLEGETYRLSFEYVGEGYDGEYFEDDPEDRKLLRYTACKKDVNGDLEVSSGSACTCLTVAVNPEDLKYLMKEMLAVLEKNKSGKSLELYSNYNDCDLEDYVNPIKNKESFLEASKE